MSKSPIFAIISMLSELNSFISKVSQLRVLVVGESIQDEFVPVSYEGHSMKSNCPVIRLQGDKAVQNGGAAAIANHLRDFVKDVSLISNEQTAIVKTRYVDIDDRRKHVEINHFNPGQFGKIAFSKTDYDLIIVADFGHGFCDNMPVADGMCFMAQTNSNNFGFNRISKWKQLQKRIVCMDLREASLQMNRRFSAMSDDQLMELFNYELNTQMLFVTLGGKGSVYTNGKQIVRQPVYKTTIVDTIGAGDTFYAFSCLLGAIEERDDFHFVPGLAASLSTTWLCNEQNVTRENLIKHAAQFV